MPYVQVWVDESELEDFDDDDLVTELEKRGFCVAKGASVLGVDRIEHLAECGFFKDAAIEALQMIERQIGKPGVLTRAH